MTKVVGEAVGLLACTKQFELVLAIEFFARLLSPLGVLTKSSQGPDATLHTAIILRDAAMKSVELRANLDTVIASAEERARYNDIATEPADRRKRKASCHLDSGAREVILSPIDELKREMVEIVDIRASEMKPRFTDKAGKLYELVDALMKSDTPKAVLHSLVADLYDDRIDADVAVAEFDVVRHIPAGLSATSLQDRAQACSPSMDELCRLYFLRITVPVTSAGFERDFSKLALIKTKLLSNSSQLRLLSLVFM